MPTTALERRPATWEEYQALGEDVHAEYIDGSIVMTPFPSRLHQNAVDRICAVLRKSAPEGHNVIAGWGWKPGADEFGPDVMVFPDTDEQIRFTGTPVLCVEVVTGNRANDYLTKVVKYAQAGLDRYWIVDPAEGTLNALVRDGEHYVLDRVVSTDRPENLTVGYSWTVDIDLAAILA